ncbi:ribosome small subunit-dependent GTPase A [bacterium SCSIO 12741]|nr:ribosome small subunit-dependent GTPase A [bacterium SCSIO 12741]
MKGRVYKSTGSWLEVKLENGESLPCKVKGKFRLKGIRSTNPIAVGDWVEIERVDDGTGVVKKLIPRNNYLIRKSVNLSHRAQILASNIDQVILLVTLKQPETTLGFIDRILCSAEAFHITPVLLFNKIDLLEEEEMGRLAEWMELYEQVGYRCEAISVEKGVNLDVVKELMTDKTSTISGHSGAGKSSLINALDPNLDLKVKAISTYHKQGVHTTTFAEMFDLDFGAQIIDTPGIRGFGVLDIDRSELSHYFLEMRELLSDCKFNNCQHINEPGCGIKKGLVEGRVAESRYFNYLDIYEEDKSENYRGTDY